MDFSKISEIKLFDSFAFRTRQQPAFIVLLPLVIAAVAWAKPDARWLGALWSLLSAAGITFFLSNNARNKGKALEPTLYALWGGTPTTQFLRHRGPANSVLRERWHRKISALLGFPLPTAQQEEANKLKADEAYEAGVKLLIAKTRDNKAFPFVYRDNVNYNFCRNLYGFKKEAVVIGSLGLLACIASSFRTISQSNPDYMPWGCTVICAVLLYWWCSTIRPEWVKVPAFNYAQHLLEGSEKISNPPGRKAKEA